MQDISFKPCCFFLGKAEASLRRPVRTSHVQAHDSIAHRAEKCCLPRSRARPQFRGPFFTTAELRRQLGKFLFLFGFVHTIRSHDL